MFLLQAKDDAADERWVVSADRSYVVANADLTAHIPTHLAAAKVKSNLFEASQAAYVLFF